MQVLFLGTSAAEGYPAIFCNCENCMKARELGGKNLRARTSILVNNDLLIDFSADTFMRSLKFNVNLAEIRYLLFTHSHSDHFYLKDLSYRFPPFARQRLPVLNVFGSKFVANLVRKEFRGRLRKCRIRVKEVEPFKEYKAGKYEIIPIRARHITSNKGETCLNYVLNYKDKSVFFSFDTGLYDDPNTWKFLNNFKFDLVVVECTLCFSEKYEYHMGFKGLELFKKKLSRSLKNSKIIATHFSHGDCPVYEELSRILKRLNIIPAYDGLRMDF